MNYGEIKKNDIANGTGVRVSIFVSGCRNHCPGCFQPETWDFNYGNLFTKEIEAEIIEALDKPWISGLSLLGGDPFEPENARVLLPFVIKVKLLFPQKNIWCYTGYTYEDLLQSPDQNITCLLKFIDVLVDGRFIEQEKDISLKFRGSRNQRILYLKSPKE